MIKNSDLFFQRAKEYQDARNKLEDKYQSDMKELKPHEGSLFFKEQSERLTREYEDRLKALRADATKSLNTIMTGMLTAIDRTPATAPTEEQLRLLETLKMRNPTKLTKEDLDRVAESLKGCPLGLKALSEIAADAGFMGYSRHIHEMSSETAADICKDNFVSDFLKFNTPRAARVAAGHKNANIPMKRRRTFSTKEECFRDLLGVGGEDLTRFCEIVDREGAVTND